MTDLPMMLCQKLIQRIRSCLRNKADPSALREGLSFLEAYDAALTGDKTKQGAMAISKAREALQLWAEAETI